MKKTAGTRPPAGAQVPKVTEKRGRSTVGMTPIPGHQPSTTQTGTESGAEASQPTSTKIGDVSDGRDTLNMTPVARNPLEKGRGAAPMTPVPTQAPKPASETPPPAKKK
jgi:hypothetical protein